VGACSIRNRVDQTSPSRMTVLARKVPIGIYGTTRYCGDLICGIRAFHLPVSVFSDFAHKIQDIRWAMSNPNPITCQPLKAMSQSGICAKNPKPVVMMFHSLNPHRPNDAHGVSIPRPSRLRTACFPSPPNSTTTVLCSSHAHSALFGSMQNCFCLVQLATTIIHHFTNTCSPHQQHWRPVWVRGLGALCFSALISSRA